jgi:hypothetical protein
MNELVFKPRKDGDTFGHVCVRYSYTVSHKPEKVTLFWPVTPVISVRDACEFFPELANGAAQELYDHGQGHYSFMRSSGQRVPIQLTNGGQTQSIDTKIETVRAPRVRAGIETRWYNGAWQKYLKSQGWVFA